MRIRGRSGNIAPDRRTVPPVVSSQRNGEHRSQTQFGFGSNRRRPTKTWSANPTPTRADIATVLEQLVTGTTTVAESVKRKVALAMRRLPTLTFDGPREFELTLNTGRSTAHGAPARCEVQPRKYGLCATAHRAGKNEQAQHPGVRPLSQLTTCFFFREGHRAPTGLAPAASQRTRANGGGLSVTTHPPLARRPSFTVRRRLRPGGAAAARPRARGGGANSLRRSVRRGMFTLSAPQIHATAGQHASSGQRADRYRAGMSPGTPPEDWARQIGVELREARFASSKKLLPPRQRPPEA